jgi:ADP-ribose pyrophosphatase
MKKLIHQYDRRDVTILQKEVLHEGFCRVERFLLQNKTFRGDLTKPYTREVVVKHKAAAALPYDPVLDKVILIEQFRAGALLQKKSPWLFEIVAGLLDKENETYEDVIYREMREEAGLEILKLIHICDYLSNPGGSTEEVRLFCAHIDSTKAPQFCSLPDENEDIKIHIISTEEAFEALHDGTINNAASIMALQWLMLNK